jgi:HEAT repeat protein
MNSHDNRKVLVVFIASPGDVDEERQVARKEVERLNRTLRSINWQIDLRGWEDTLPGRGRPQELINADIHACKLFIGLLSTRWGTPTGKYGSGFEEEYRLAVKLQKQHGIPEIWLFFKRIPAAQLKDPGDQLAKVLEFRKEVIAGREVLFKDIKNKAEWKERLPEMLLEYILKLHEQIHARQLDSSPDSPPASSFTLPLEKDDTDISSMQLNDTLNAALANPASFDKLGAFMAARLHLFAATAMARYTNDRLGLHEANLLYLHREKIELTHSEQSLLYKTVIGGAGDVFPGWYWFKDHDIAETKQLLFLLATTGSDDQTRFQSVELLTGSGIQPDIAGPDRANFIGRFLDDSSAEVRRVKVDYLKKVGQIEDVPALERLTSDPDEKVRNKAEEACELIIADSDPRRILMEAVSLQKDIRNSVAKVLTKHSEKFSSTELAAASGNPNPTVRLFVAKILESRRVLTPDIASRFSEDSSDEVKSIGYRELMRAGATVDLNVVDNKLDEATKDSAVESMALLPIDTLLTKIELYPSFESLTAFEALARHHFAMIAVRLRSELGTSFESLRDSFLARLEPYASQFDDTLKAFKKGGDIDAFVRAKYISIALRALVQNGNRQDASFGRLHLLSKDSSVRHAAIALLERFGEDSDSNMLMETVKDDYLTGADAAGAAIRIASDPTAVINNLLDSDSTLVVRVAIKAIETKNLSVVQPKLYELLRHEVDDVRALTVAAFHRLIDNAALESLLTSYTNSGGRYYYNVVCWLDRLLYSPAPIRQWFIRSANQYGLQSRRSVLDD